jgi:NADPH:quinone reductase-like Zn-dependent oxidoreductase
MKAIVQTQYSADYAVATALVLSHPMPEPAADKGQARVRVAYAATNPIDPKFARGDLQDLLASPMPCPVGRDFSGWIDVIPSGCANPRGLCVGDRVCGFLDHKQLDYGAMAEYLCAPLAVLGKVPPEVPLRAAAGVALAGITTYVALVETFNLAPGCGKKIVILGGSSATGMLALQLARLYGCADIVCTSTNEALCLSLGATRVVDYRVTEWSEVLAGQNFDFVYDTVGDADASYEASHTVLGPKGLFYTIVGDIPVGTRLTIGKLLGSMCGGLCRGCCSGPTYQMCQDLPSTADHGVTFWLELLAQGKAAVVLDTPEPFAFEHDAAVRMLEKQIGGRCKGKLVMVIAGDEGTA